MSAPGSLPNALPWGNPRAEQRDLLPAPGRGCPATRVGRWTSVKLPNCIPAQGPGPGGAHRALALGLGSKGKHRAAAVGGTDRILCGNRPSHKRHQPYRAGDRAGGSVGSGGVGLEGGAWASGRVFSFTVPAWPWGTARARETSRAGRALLVLCYGDRNGDRGRDATPDDPRVP